MYDKHENFAVDEVLSAPSPDVSGTSLTLTDDTLGSEVPFNAVVWPHNTVATKDNAEIVRVTANASGTLTILRAQEGTTAQPIAAGWKIANSITKKIFTDIEESVDAKVAKNELVINVKDYGAVGNGSTNDTAAINAAIAALPASMPTWGGLSGVLFFPPGVYRTSGGHVIPVGKKVLVRGSGRSNTVLYGSAASGADLLTINSNSSSVQEMTLDGAGLVTDCLVLNAGDTSAINCVISEAGQDGVAVGKASSAINFILRDLNIRLAMRNGVRVYSSGSTDGAWDNVNVGNSGQHGLYIDDGSQIINNCHIWGSGIQGAAPNNNGIHLATGHNTITGTVVETNNGYGVYLGTSDDNNNQLIGCFIWANANAGIFAYNSGHHVISDCTIMNNGSKNRGDNNLGNSGIINYSGYEWVISGNKVYDTAQAIPAGTYGTTPPYPYLGRPSGRTQTYPYYEMTDGTALGKPRNCVITGNTMRNDQTRNGLAVFTISDTNKWANNDLGTVTAPTIASAATVTLESYVDTAIISGTTQIDTITASYIGRTIRLMFTGAVALSTAGNLTKALTMAAGDIVTLQYNGTKWDTMGIIQATLSESGTILSDKYLALAGGTMTGTLTGQSLEPSTTLTYNLGTTNYYNQVRSRRYYLNSTAYFDGSVAGTAALTGTLTVSVDATVAGNIYTTSIRNTVTTNNSQLSLGNFGTTITRNIADASSALVINQAHASSTGNIVDFKVAGTIINVMTYGGSLGLLTTAPTHTFTLGYTANGMVQYLTASQVTNYERVLQYQASSVYNIESQAAGTGVARPIKIGGVSSKITVQPNGVLLPFQAITASAPTYVKGGIYFDTTLNKLMVGGATAWEQITSA